jgi:hypothetical protein
LARQIEHLEYEKGDPAGRGNGTSRNGASAKAILTEDGEISTPARSLSNPACRRNGFPDIGHKLM